MVEGVIEREAEIEILSAAVSRAATGAGVGMVVEGVAGIGKSALLSALHSIAIDNGFGVLDARATTLESAYGYGVLRHLLDGPLRTTADDRRAQLLSGPAALVGTVVGMTAPRPHPVDVFAVGYGIWWLLEGLSREAPLVLTVDDAQWADDVSLRALSYVLRRAGDLPLVIALGWRVGEGRNDEILDALHAEGDIVHIRPAPLTRQGSVRLVAALRPDLRDDVARSCHDAAGGILS